MGNESQIDCKIDESVTNFLNSPLLKETLVQWDTRVLSGF